VQTQARHRYSDPPSRTVSINCGLASPNAGPGWARSPRSQRTRLRKHHIAARPLSDDGASLTLCSRNRLNYGAAAVDHVDALRWATAGLAACLGHPDIGELAVGMGADIAMFRLDEPRFSASHDPLAALVLCGAHRADRVIVATQVDAARAVRGQADRSARSDDSRSSPFVSSSGSRFRGRQRAPSE